jgi:hypothetical protein
VSGHCVNTREFEKISKILRPGKAWAAIPIKEKEGEMGQGNESCFKVRSRAASTTANLSERIYEITRNQFQSFSTYK